MPRRTDGAYAVVGKEPEVAASQHDVFLFHMVYKLIVYSPGGLQFEEVGEGVGRRGAGLGIIAVRTLVIVKPDPRQKGQLAQPRKFVLKVAGKKQRAVPHVDGPNRCRFRSGGIQFASA